MCSSTENPVRVTVLSHSAAPAAAVAVAVAAAGKVAVAVALAAAAAAGVVEWSIVLKLQLLLEELTLAILFSLIFVGKMCVCVSRLM